MLEVARANAPAATFKEARAEELPFKDGWFERVVMWLSSHLVDRRRAFAEANRVLGADGRLGVVTFDPSYFDDVLAEQSCSRRWAASTGTVLDRRGARGRAAGGGLRGSRAHAPLPDRRPQRDAALERIRGKHISTFDLISHEEYEEGLARAERELPERIEYPIEWLVAVAFASGGLERACDRQRLTHQPP